MSLDVCLDGAPSRRQCEYCNGAGTIEVNDAIYDANITHNLATMANAAGIYVALWRPEDLGIRTAKQLIEPLRAGLALLKFDPEKFKRFNPPNGWGNYEAFVPWVENYLAACEANPDAKVRVSR